MSYTLAYGSLVWWLETAGPGPRGECRKSQGFGGRAEALRFAIDLVQDRRGLL